MLPRISLPPITLALPPLSSAGFRVWDPILLLSQIILLQAYHYLVLSLLVPPFLATFASTDQLVYEGGPLNVAMIVDWREMSGKDTVRAERGYYTSLPSSLGRKTGVEFVGGIGGLEETGRDGRKAAVIGLAWAVASLIDIIPLLYLVRRPTHILDHSLTLLFIHLLITTYYSSSFPTSPWFWTIIASSAIIQIVWAEKLCVEREMRDGFREGGMVREWWSRSRFGEGMEENGGAGAGAGNGREERLEMVRVEDGKVRIRDEDDGMARLLGDERGG
ncbi:hypothetical protein BT69DRAFT_1318957 [Atractiella rhizophila]|nr:hypothetical protein BT69DRAFT_1318957 [Atractiella rhizophila]